MLVGNDLFFGESRRFGDGVRGYFNEPSPADLFVSGTESGVISGPSTL